MRLRNAARVARGSDHHNNVVSWISEVKETSNVAVRKKRGRRAPPSTKRVCDKKVDEVLDCDDAVDNDIDDTYRGQVGKSQTSAHIEAHVDGRTGNDLPKPGQSGIFSNDPSSASEGQDHLTNSEDNLQAGSSQTTKVFGSSIRRKDGASHLGHEGANEDGSHQQVVVNKVIEDERNSQKIKGDVYDVQADTTSDVKNSEEVEDVKVCDICGDVGEEEKLAVCSRCNDGAEHTYCMRVMLEEVPDSEWLCEDCQTAVESEKEKKREKSQVKVGTSKWQSFQGGMNKSAFATKGQSSSDNELESENAGNKESDTVNERNDTVKNRIEEDAVITASVRGTIPETGGVYMGADSRKRMPLSCERLFGFDADKEKQSSHQVVASLVSNTVKNQAPQPRGQLSKSTSFNNSKVPKVKQLLNEVPKRPKNLKESWSSIIRKEAPISMTTKSATFKKPKPSESASKAKPSILSPVEEIRHAEKTRVTNQLINHNVTNDQCSSILGVPSTTASIVAPVLSKADATVQPLTAGNITTDSNNLGTAHVQGGKNCNGNSELKKPLLEKLPGSTTLSNAERSLGGILGSGTQRKVTQNLDPLNWDAKIKDSTGFRQGACSSNRTIHCQRCNEAGHSTQFCAVDKLRLSAIKPLSERNLKDTSVKRNKTSETSTLAVIEKTASISVNQSDEILKCGTYQNPIFGAKDVLPTSVSHVKKPSFLPGRANEQDMTFKDDHPTLSSTTGIFANKDHNMPCRDESNEGFSTGEPMTSTVPEPNWIWQGGFELQKTGRSPELCDGFQAHLSCSASQLVLDVAKKFPSIVQLEEVPRLNSWPTQFQENGPTYDNVGIFFFARDVQSYEKHYSKLVENMLKNDLILRGSVDAVELLIFPSNILSKRFQRWNMFYFLWGVFRVGRKDCSNHPCDVPMSRLEPKDNPHGVDPSICVLSSSHSFSKDRNSFAGQNPNMLKSTNCLLSSEANHEGHSNGRISLNQPLCGRALDDHQDSARCLTNSDGSMGPFGMAMERKHQNPNYLEHQDKMRTIFCGNVSGRDLDVNKVPVACSASSTNQEVPGKQRTAINLNDPDDLMDIDHVNTGELSTRALDPSSHASGVAHKRKFDMANRADEVDGAHNKKIKLDNVVPMNSGLSRI